MKIDFQRITDALEKSSSQVKDLLFSPALGDELIQIAESCNLDENLYPDFVDEVGYVLLELKDQTTFINSLTNIGIPKEIALSLEKEVITKILSKSSHKVKDTDLSKKIAQNIRAVKNQKSATDLLNSISKNQNG